jgi:hypothetical protein
LLYCSADEVRQMTGWLRASEQFNVRPMMIYIKLRRWNGRLLARI